MPVIDKEKLEAYAQAIFERESRFNDFTLKTIARRIKATGQLSAYDQKALKNMADISGDMDKITKELARITKMNIGDVEKIYVQVINDSINSYKPLYDFRGMAFVPITQNDRAMKLVRHWTTLTAGKMVNLSNTKSIGFTDRNGRFTGIQGAFQRTIDDAVVAVSSGVTDFNSAMRLAIEQLGGSGVVVNYGNGVTRSIEGMVRQNLLWGAKQAAQSYDDYVAEELGLDGFEVDAHSGCRHSHKFMQGKMYSYKGDKVINGVLYEDGKEALERLKDYGCLHFKTGVLLGVSEPRYSKEELEQIHKESTEKIEYEGREKTLYEWKQTQRRLERAVREQKGVKVMAQASGDKLLVRECDERIKRYQSKYEEISEITGIAKDTKRMSVQKLQNVWTNDTKRSIINVGNEVFRTKSNKNGANRIALSQKKFDELIIEAKKNGAKIIKCEYDDEIFKHLEKSGATASCIGDTLLFRPDVTISEVLEETHHFMQNVNGLNDDKSAILRTILNEIEAKEFIINNAKKYNVPRTEIEETMKHLKSYEKQLKEYFTEE